MNPLIRTKFVVRSVIKPPGLEEVTLVSVIDAGANTGLRKAAYNLPILIDNPAAQGKLIVGKEYYLDFTPVEVPAVQTTEIGGPQTQPPPQPAKTESKT